MTVNNDHNNLNSTDNPTINFDHPKYPAKLDEQYFSIMRSIASERLHPMNISSYFFVLFFVGLLFSGIPLYFIFFTDDVNVPIFQLIGKVNVVLFILQFFIGLIFFSKYVTMKLQVLQIFILPLCVIKFALDTYFFYFYLCYTMQVDPRFYKMGIISICLGLILLIYSVKRLMRRVHNGAFKEDGNGFLDYEGTKNQLGIGFIFMCSSIGGVIPKLFNGYNFQNELQVIVFLLICNVIYYCILFVIPEFLLLAYCKKRFSSFKIKD